MERIDFHAGLHTGLATEPAFMIPYIILCLTYSTDTWQFAFNIATDNTSHFCVSRNNLRVLLSFDI